VIGLALADDGSANEIARPLARPRPRIAGRLLRRGPRLRRGRRRKKKVTAARFADSALKLLDVDVIGLDEMDRRYLDVIALKFRRRSGRRRKPSPPRLSEPRDAISRNIIEPYLIQLGFVQRTPRGRLLTSATPFRHLGLARAAARGITARFVRGGGNSLSDRTKTAGRFSHIVSFLEALASEPRRASVNTIDAYRRESRRLRSLSQERGGWMR